MLLDREIEASNLRGSTETDMSTEDIDLINAQGPHWHGRETVRRNTQRVVDDFRPRLSYELISSEKIAPDVHLVISKGTATMPEGIPGPKSVSMHQMRVLVRRGQEWRVRALQSTPIMVR